MALKELYWIDDSSKHMLAIIDNVFPLLWDAECSCISILFGNAYCAKADEIGPDQGDGIALSKSITDKFVRYCEDLDRFHWRDYGYYFAKKKELLSEPSARIISMSGSPEEPNNPIRSLAYNWMDSKKLKEFIEATKSVSTDEAAKSILTKDALKKSALSVETLIDTMKIPPKAPVALDIYLLYGDGTRTQNGEPTISMALYYTLSKEHPCYLYSNMAVSQDRAKQWTKCYKKLFHDDDVVIHPKTGLTTIEISTAAKKSLVEMINQTEKELK